MTAPRVLTFCDVIDSMVDFASNYGGAPSQATLRQSILNSYSEFTSAHDWRYLNANGRLQLQAARSTGTVAYTHSTKTLTLTGSTWPSDMENWCVRFDSVVCDVDTRSSDTVLILDSTMNPGADVAAGTTYLAYPRWYELPSNFVRMSRPMDETSWWLGEYVDMETLLALERYEGGNAGDVQYYSFGPSGNTYGAMALYVWPPSDATVTYDYIYKKQPRELRYSGKDSGDSVGTIAVTAASKTVTGTSTAFSSLMEGSIVRIGSSSTNAPTRIAGAYPWLEEHRIKTFTSTTALTLETAVTTSRSGVKCVVSDPVDIPLLLHNAFLACCKKNLAHERNFKELSAVVAVYEDAMLKAKCADAPVGQKRVAGGRTIFYSRLSDGTVGGDV